jgi:hypothetical protein
MIKSEHLPYIYHEDLYLIPNKEGVTSSVTTKPTDIVKNEPTAVTQTTPSVPAANPITWRPIQQGNNTPLSVVLWSETMSMNDQQKIFLSKIVQACKIDFTQVNIYHQQLNNGITFLQHVTTPVCLVVAHPDAQATIQKAQLQKYNAFQHINTKVILVDSLEALESDVALKTKLWNQLKLVFSL